MNIKIARFFNFAFSIFARGWSILSLLLVNFLIANYLSPSDAGVFLLLFNTFFVACIVSRIGADSFLVKLVSRNSERLAERLEKLIFNYFLIYLFVCCIVVFLFLYFKDFVVQYFSLTVESSVYFCFVYSIPFSCFSYFVSFYFQGIRKFNLSILCLNFISYSSFLISFLFIDFNLVSLSISFFLCQVLSFLFSVFVLFIQGGKVTAKPSLRLMKKLLFLSIPFFFYSLSSQLIIWGGQIIASTNLSAEEYGGYSIAHRVSQILSVILMFINFFFMPQFAKSFKERNIFLIQKLCSRIVSLLLPLSLMLGSLLIFFSSYILGLFGDFYTEFKNVLVLLVVAQIVNLSTGSVGYLLSMSGNQSTLTLITVAVSSIYLVFAYILSLTHGVMGLSFAASAVVVVQNLLLVYVVFKKTGINTLKIYNVT